MVVGCSTGALHALTTLLSGLRADLPVPVILVCHRGQEDGDLLAELLARASPLPVIEAEERQAVEKEDGPGTALCVRGHLKFDDFLQMACTFCMYTKDDLLLFAFNAFDLDNSGVIDELEFMQLCLVVNNDKPTYPDNFKLALISVVAGERGSRETCTCGAPVIIDATIRRRAILGFFTSAACTVAWRTRST